MTRNILDPTIDSDFVADVYVKNDDGDYIDPSVNVVIIHVKTEDSKNKFYATNNPFEGQAGSPFENIPSAATEVVEVEGVKVIRVRIPANTFEAGGYIYVKTELLLIDGKQPDGILNVSSCFLLQTRRYYDC